MESRMKENNLCIPLPTARAIAALGVKVESDKYWQPLASNRLDVWRVSCMPKGKYPEPRFAAYSLGELPAVLKEIARVKGWEEYSCRVHFKADQCGIVHTKTVENYFLEICRLYSESSGKGWSYLENIIK